MSSYEPKNALGRLRRVRATAERAAELELGRALEAKQRADEEAGRLAVRLTAARRRLDHARQETGAVGAKTTEGRVEGAAEASLERAADAQVRRRYWARLEAEIRTAAAALAAHKSAVLAPAERGLVTARASHARAGQQREVVDKAIAAREAEARRIAERRAEAEADDRPRPSPSPSRRGR